MKNNRKRNVTAKAKWMPCPKIETDYPGLAYIRTLDELIVVKEKDALHDVIGGKGIGYTIFNKDGEKVFLAVQNTRCQKFVLKVFNHYGNEVIQVKRPRTLCVSKALVWAPPGNFVGSVKKVRSCVSTFLVENQSGNLVLTIKAEGLFRFVYSIKLNDKDIGAVSKEWKNATVFNVKHFGLSFPINMDIEDKAVLIGACFLIGCLKY